MKRAFLVCIGVLGFVACGSDKESNNNIFVPDVGINGLVINEKIDDEIESIKDILIFKDASGRIEYLYSENKRYTLAAKSGTIVIGSKFDNIKQDGLTIDRATSDIMSGNWYISKEGYILVVSGNIVKGIGVCRRSE